MLTAHTRARFSRFFIVGGIGFVVQLGSVRLLKEVLPPRVAFTIAFMLSVSTHYLLNRFWALTSVRTDTRRQFLEYLGTVGQSYLVSYLLFNLFLYVATARRHVVNRAIGSALDAGRIPACSITVFLKIFNNRLRDR